MNRLLNKTALVTGGTSGIGLATAREFISEGAKVIITGRNEESLKTALKELGANATGFISDTSDLFEIRELCRKVSDKMATIDILFINAGIAKFAPIEDIDEASFDEQFNINVKGAYFTIQQLLPLMPAGSSIILNTSINAHIGRPNASVYAATKAALLAFAKNLSAELVHRKIRVNAISPGPVETPFYGKLGIPENYIDKATQNIKDQIPLGRFASALELARVAAFFASDDSSFLLGAELIADGGMSWA